ncbi:protein of unknown function (plasmid) [Caballeronia sp. S22]
MSLKWRSGPGTSQTITRTAARIKADAAAQSRQGIRESKNQEVFIRRLHIIHYLACLIDTDPRERSPVLAPLTECR